MINLAGRIDCDKIIEQELKRAKISIVYVGKSKDEVPFSIEGKIGDVTFRRAWYYWIATGKIPLNIALSLYKDPVGKTDIRVSGHCGQPPPEDPWIKYEDKFGHQIILDENGLEQKSLFSFRKSFGDTFGDNLVFVKTKSEREEIASNVFIEMYHIDSEIGLRVFADTINALVTQQ
jgi:hypothetical protein